MGRFIPSRGVVACLRHFHKHTSCLIQNSVQSAIVGQHVQCPRLQTVSSRHWLQMGVGGFMAPSK